MTNADLSLVRGDDQDIPLNVTNPDGTPYNLSGSVLAFTAFCDSASDTPFLTKLVTGNAANVSGSAFIPFVTGDTATLGNGPFPYYLKLTSTVPQLTTLANGNLYIYPLR